MSSEVPIPEEAIEAAKAEAEARRVRFNTGRPLSVEQVVRAAIEAAAPLIVAAHESAEIERLTGFLARVGWEICTSCNGRGGTATRADVQPCGDCGGFCLQKIEDESDDEDGPDYRDPWTLTPDDMELREGTTS